MKTDKLLHLMQQKNAMRSGGALPLPKHQSRGQVAPYITSDPKEFARRQQLYKDSLDLYNRQNLYNAQFLANFPNAPVIPNDRVDFRELVNIIRQQDKTSVEKNATELVNILKNGVPVSKTYTRHYPSDGRYKAHIKRTEGPLLKPGHYVPNSVANRRGLIDSLGGFDDDTKSAKHSYSERMEDPSTNTWIRSGSVTQKWKNLLGFFDDEHTSQVFGVPYRVIRHDKIKPIGNLLYHHRIPFTTGSSGAAGIFDPSSVMYDDASALNVSLPYYKKPVQEVVLSSNQNLGTIQQKTKPPQKTTSSKPKKQLVKEMRLPMRGITPLDIDIEEPTLRRPEHPQGSIFSKEFYPGRTFYYQRDSKGNVRPIEESTYGQLKQQGVLEYEEGGLAKAQAGLEYVSNGTYGNYYDPSTQQYIPQVYLPDVEISASKSLPFQNGKFAPFLASRGMVENSVFDDPIALAAGAAAAGLGLGAYGASQLPKMFARNLASEATMGASDLASIGLKKLANTSDLTYDLARMAQDPGDMPGAAIEDAEDIISMEDRIKNYNKLLRQEGIIGFGKYKGSSPKGGRFEFVPEEYMREAKGMTAKEKSITPKDFYSSSELQKKINQLAEYQKAQDAFEEMKPLSGADMIMSAFTGDKSRDELFQSLFPNVSMPKWNEKFIRPEHAEQLAPIFKYMPSQFYKNPLSARNLGFAIKDKPEIPHSVSSYLSQKGNTWYKDDPLGYVREMYGPTKVEGLSADDVRRLAEEKQKKMMGMQYRRMISDLAVPFEASDAVRLGLSPNKTGGLTSSKAREILHDKSVHGHPLTDKQRRFFGAIASGNKIRVKLKK